MHGKLMDRICFHAWSHRWRAYDTNNGFEVAWNVVKLNRIPPSERKRIKTEVKLLKDIEHKNVIRYYNSWVDREKEQIIFVKEMMSSGSLKEWEIFSLRRFECLILSSLFLSLLYADTYGRIPWSDGVLSKGGVDKF